MEQSWEKSWVRLERYKLTTAEITYHLPDHPALLQTFVWQVVDQAPHYPRLSRFLDYWRKHLDARLHSVRIGAGTLATEYDLRHADHLITVH